MSSSHPPKPVEEAADASSGDRRQIGLTVAYDGTGYAGWQVQPDHVTVQEVIESAIHRLTGETVRIIAAGRTDAGVHSLGQEVGFFSGSTIPPEKWSAALRAHLPDDVVVLSSREVSGDFHATYSAKSKRYRYLIRRAAAEDPVLRKYSWRIDGKLDLLSMRTAMQALLGRHDFRCFESHWPNKASSVRTVLDVQLHTVDRWPGWSAAPVATTSAPSNDDSAEFIVFEIEADGFLYNMVRAIVGTLVRIGRGDWPADALAQIIASQNRSEAGETAPPQGLYLVSVTY